ncbi:hypothetical protein LCGC14_2209080 [marine sediment metagenome]|uniref:ASCH domain-containing protein n=1 Tax=marine sediment metagenome TaxID=412755 RepID=A0A0F9E1V4_9ZZZZ
MRILGFSKKWDKLNNIEFTTFRSPRKDRDWEADETVQIVYKPRSKKRESLGTARIISKEFRFPLEITEEEAIKDGFNNALEVWLFLKKPKNDTPMNKLTLRWLNEWPQRTA